MKVKMLRTLSGADGVQRVGTEQNFPDDEAERLIAAGIAEAAEPAKDSKKKPDAPTPPATPKLEAVPKPPDAATTDDGKDDADRPADPNASEEHDDPDKNQPPREPNGKELLAMTRPVLDAAAVAAGVTEPEKLGNKQAVVDAILATRKG